MRCMRFKDTSRLFQQVDFEIGACDLALLLSKVGGKSIDDALRLLDVRGPLALALVLVAQHICAKAPLLARHVERVRQGSRLDRALHVVHDRQQIFAQ